MTYVVQEAIRFSVESYLQISTIVSNQERGRFLRVIICNLVPVALPHLIVGCFFNFKILKINFEDYRHIEFLQGKFYSSGCILSITESF